MEKLKARLGGTDHNIWLFGAAIEMYQWNCKVDENQRNWPEPKQLLSEPGFPVSALEADYLKFSWMVCEHDALPPLTVPFPMDIYKPVWNSVH